MDRVFEKLKINLALEMMWQGDDDDEDVVVNLAMNGTKVAKGTDLQQLMWRELDDLLCRLFYDAKRVVIHPVTPGQSATGVLSVQPFTRAGVKNTVIVKFGSIDKIKQEHANFKEYIESRLGGGRSTIVHDLRQTPHLGGIIYSFVGATNTDPEDFGRFYHHAGSIKIKTTIDNLFHETCGNWYGDKSRLQPLNLADDYQRLLHFTPERLAKGVQDLSPSVQRGERLHFQNVHEERTFTDPVRAAASRRARIYSTYTCITHGDLNSHNILLDKNDNTWLIDFLRTGQGHVLRDLSQLDSVIRFELLAGHEATLDERLHMEEALCSIESFQQLKDLQARLSTNSTALGKAYATVLHIRDLAWNVLGHKPQERMDEYYTALFYHALNTVRFYDLSQVQREHALLSASLLADKLRLSV
ncbi:phosphotransferase [Dictyobacter halimunensis]